MPIYQEADAPSSEASCSPELTKLASEGSENWIQGVSVASVSQTIVAPRKSQTELSPLTVGSGKV